MKHQKVVCSKHQVPGFCILITYCLLLIALHNASFAQTAISSPYSRYGIGDVSGKGFAQNFAMGGTHIAFQNDTVPFHNYINNGNPASYSNMPWTSAEVGLRYNRVALQNASTQKTIHSASLSYMSLAFPLKKYWGASVGLLPFSSVGYKVTDHQDVSSVGGVDYLYEGTGGINQLYFGSGIRPFPKLPYKFSHSKKFLRLNSSVRPDRTVKTCRESRRDFLKSNRIMNSKRLLSGLSLGANASYLFGNFNNTRRSVFPNSTFPMTPSSYLNTFSGTTTRVSDVYFDYGLQLAYTIDSVRQRTPSDSCRPVYRDLKQNVKILFGVNFATQTDIAAKMDTVSYNYYLNQVGGEIIVDTTQNSQRAKGTITLPLSVGFGLGFKKGNTWLIGADFAIQNWSSYQAFDHTQGLKNSMRVSLGAQYVPKSETFKSASSSYFNRVHYRLGARYVQTSLELKNTPITEYAVSAGLGLPVGPLDKRRDGNYSMVNVSLELGERGTITNGLIRERFFKLAVGFTINDRWFDKRKFD